MMMTDDIVDIDGIVIGIDDSNGIVVFHCWWFVCSWVLCTPLPAHCTFTPVWIHTALDHTCTGHTWMGLHTHTHLPSFARLTPHMGSFGYTLVRFTVPRLVPFGDVVVLYLFIPPHIPSSHLTSFCCWSVVEWRVDCCCSVIVLRSRSFTFVVRFRCPIQFLSPHVSVVVVGVRGCWICCSVFIRCWWLFIVDHCSIRLLTLLTVDDH